MDRRRGQDTGPAPTEDAAWWAGLGLTGGVVLVLALIGAGLFLRLVLRGDSADSDWSHHYGAGKILAIGCVVPVRRSWPAAAEGGREGSRAAFSPAWGP
ncbi:hypothetical protein [Streptomyces sp. NPDC056160]|uniref:hypothetical protein n=1 Tax=Streptomyces sp. NPDC056160 TaxID=3345731 RepID=UPI0035D92832